MLRAVEVGVAEAIELPVGVGEPVALAAYCWCDANYSCWWTLEGLPSTELAVKLCVPPSEDVSFAGHNPVPPAVGCRCDGYCPVCVGDPAKCAVGTSAFVSGNLTTWLKQPKA
jgi:hypothetical protein